MSREFTPDTCPVGTRFLYKIHDDSPEVYEATVQEWSDGGYVKVWLSTGGYFWNVPSHYRLIEVLPEAAK